RICQSPCTERTAPCAPATDVRPKNNAMAMAPAINGCLACRLETPMPVDPQRCSENAVGSNSALIGNDGALKADTRVFAPEGGRTAPNQVPVEHPTCAD